VTGGGQVGLAVGTRLTYDGRVWEVAEVSPPHLLLADALGGLRQVGLGHLLAHPGTRAAGRRRGCRRGWGGGCGGGPGRPHRG
jgi:hypothetical protein